MIGGSRTMADNFEKNETPIRQQQRRNSFFILQVYEFRIYRLYDVKEYSFLLPGKSFHTEDIPLPYLYMTPDTFYSLC